MVRTCPWCLEDWTLKKEPLELLRVATLGVLEDLIALLLNDPYCENCNRASPNTGSSGSDLSSTDQSDNTVLSTELRQSEPSTSSASISTRHLYASALVDVLINDEGDTALGLAASALHDVAIQTLICAGADVNKACNAEQTPLMLVVGVNNPNIDIDKQKNCAQLLLQAGADLEAQDNVGRTALMKAAENGSVNSVQFLLKAGAYSGIVDNEGETALMIASRFGNVSCVEVLVNEPKRQINAVCCRGRTALIHAIRGFRIEDDIDYVKCVKLLTDAGSDINIHDKFGRSALVLASTNTMLVDSLRVLLQADGVDVDRQDYEGMTAVMHAVSTGNHRSLQCLVNSGASVNAVSFINQTSVHFLFSDHRFVQCAKKCLMILLDGGANVNAVDDYGVTPLMNIIDIWIRSNALALLVDHGANVNIVDKEGCSALLYVIRHYIPRMHTCENVKYLLKNGADPNLNPLQGKSVLATALDTKHAGLVKLLVEHGVELKLEWEVFQEIFDSTGNIWSGEILQLLIINGMWPATQMSSTGEQYTYSFIQSALNKGSSIDVIKYFIANGYLHKDDLSFISYRSSVHNRFPPDPLGHQSTQLLMTAMGSQPWPLVKMCFVTVSTLFGASPGRHERIEKSQLPTKLQDMLMFKEPESRLCHHNWDDIPLTFNPQEYERLPRPRPLLYNWPIGRPLVTCDCGQCDGTMYKYEEDDEQSDSDSDY